MKISVVRKSELNNSILGEMYLDGTFQCFTLENKELHIPAGAYPVTFYDSPHNHGEVPLLEDVPGRSMIEIHVANFSHELLGCIAVGTAVAADTLQASRSAFNLLMLKLKASPDPIIIEIC